MAVVLSVKVASQTTVPTLLKLRGMELEQGG